MIVVIEIIAAVKNPPVGLSFLGFTAFAIWFQQHARRRQQLHDIQQAQRKEPKRKVGAEAIPTNPWKWFWDGKPPPDEDDELFEATRSSKWQNRAIARRLMEEHPFLPPDDTLLSQIKEDKAKVERKEGPPPFPPDTEPTPDPSKIQITTYYKGKKQVHIQD